MQKVFILLVVSGCAILVGRRLFRSLGSRGRETGCGGCAGCGGSGLPPSCPHDDKAGAQKRDAGQGQAGPTKKNLDP